MEIVAPSALTNILECMPPAFAGPSASPEKSPVWMICGMMASSAIAGRSECVTPQPAAKAAAIDSAVSVRFMVVLPVAGRLRACFQAGFYRSTLGCRIALGQHIAGWRLLKDAARRLE